MKISVNAQFVRDNNLQGVVDMLNGIAIACHCDDEFQEGWRNKVIVDLVAGSHMVGLEPEVVFATFVDNDLIDPKSDDQDTYRRVETVMDYSDRFSWDWLIDPEDYVDKAKQCCQPVPVEFVLV